MIAPATERLREGSLELRWRVLRAPWGQPRGSELDELEDVSHQRVAINSAGVVVGTARLHEADPGTGQIRYMAVDPAWERRGVGRALVEALEAEARLRGLRTMILEAREPVMGFYQRLGYRVSHPGKVLFGAIPHVWMTKEL